MTDLLDAVDKLTQPDIVLTRVGDNTNWKPYRRVDAPLLEQLDAAVSPSVGGTGSGKLAHTRINIAANAFDKRAEIDERLRAWLRGFGAQPGAKVTPAQMILTWRVLYLAGVHTLEEDQNYETVVKRWATDIRDIIDAPTQIPYSEPCPLCGATRAQWWADGQVNEGAALWAFLRPDYRDEGSFGLCRACHQIVARATGPVELRYRMNVEIEQATRMTQTIEEATAREPA